MSSSAGHPARTIREIHCPFGSVPAFAAGGAIWIGAPAGAVWILAAGRDGGDGGEIYFGAPLLALEACPAAPCRGGSGGSSVMMLTGGIDAADGKLMVLPADAGLCCGGPAATGAGAVVAGLGRAAVPAGCHPDEYFASSVSNVLDFRLALIRLASMNKANSSHCAALQPCAAST